MSLFHAVAFIDHQSAEVLQFDSEHVLEKKIHHQQKFTRQHGSLVRTEHEFFSRMSATPWMALSKCWLLVDIRAWQTFDITLTSTDQKPQFILLITKWLIIQTKIKCLP